MNKRVNLVEIGPRDGFQSIKDFIPTEEKIRIIDGIVESGYKKVEVTSFVSPKAIPQMKDSKEVATLCMEKYPNVDFYALVPNLYGARTAVELGMKEVAPVISLSESHNKVNVNKTVNESIEEIAEIHDTYPDLKLLVEIATVFGCPFEGNMTIESLLSLISRLYDFGIREFVLCDTIGVAYPEQVRKTFEAVQESYFDCKFGVHIHDTRNMGIVNTYTAINSGADEIQTSIGGLGGCPFAPGASGNTSSEDLVYLLNKEGYETGIDFNKLLETAKYTRKTIDGNFSGHHIEIEL